MAEETSRREKERSDAETFPVRIEGPVGIIEVIKKGGVPQSSKIVRLAP